MIERPIARHGEFLDGLLGGDQPMSAGVDCFGCVGAALLQQVDERSPEQRRS